MKECYSDQAIKEMFTYGQVHLLLEFVLLLIFLMLVVYFYEKFKKVKTGGE